MKWILPLLLIPSIAFSQGLATGEKEYDYPSPRECGLVTRWASNVIPPSCLTEARNVYFDEDLSVYRRRGQAEYNATPCTDSKAIKGMWKFNATDGQRYVVIFSSQSFFWTKNQGDCNPIVGLSGLNADAEYECVQTLGELWCTNGINTGFSTNVSTFTLHPDMPLGTKIGTFRNRVVIANAPGELSRIRLSGEGDGSDWTIKIPGQSTSPASIDISGLNDGKEVTALLGQYQDAYYIGREDDMSGLYGNDRRNFTLRQISSQIGVLESRSVKEKDNCLVWLSRRGIEKMCGTTIERASDPIRDQIDVIIGATGNTRTKTYNSPDEWEAGLYQTQLPNQGPTSTTIYPGSVVPSTWGHVNTEGAHWAAGTANDISTSSIDGSITLAVSTNSAMFDSFVDKEYAANPTWTFESGTNKYSASSGSMTYTSSGLSNTNGSISSYYQVSDGGIINDGKWEALMRTAIGAAVSAGYKDTVDLMWNFMDSGSGANGYGIALWQESLTSCSGATATLYKITNGIRAAMATDNVTCSGSLANYSITCSNVVIKRTGNVFTAIDSSCGLDITVSDSEPYYNSASKTIIKTTVYEQNTLNASLTGQIGNIKLPAYENSGVWSSPEFDTTFSTTVAGPYRFVDDVPFGSTVVYKVAQSADSVTWDDWITVSTTTSGEFRLPLTKRYWKESIELSTQHSTQTPVVNMTSLEATATGYYIGDCINATGLTSWGNFRPDARLSGGSDISYAVTGGDSCHQVTRATATWTTQNANAPVSISTYPYLGFRVFETPVTTTDTLRLDALTVEWNEGSERPPVSAEVYRNRYYLFYTTNTSAGSYNDHALVFDMNDKWSLLDGIHAYSSVVYENQLYTGDSRNTGKIHIQDVGTSDVGEDYGFAIKTNDYDFGNPIEKKVLKRVYLMLKSEEKPGQDIDLTLKYYINGSTTAYSLNSVGLEETPEKGYFVAKFPAINTQPTTFNWLGLSLEYDGEEGPVNLYGIKLVYSPIRWE